MCSTRISYSRITPIRACLDFRSRFRNAALVNPLGPWSLLTFLPLLLESGPPLLKGAGEHVSCGQADIMVLTVVLHTLTQECDLIQQPLSGAGLYYKLRPHIGYGSPTLPCLNLSPILVMASYVKL
jgi:hypothetical protein